MNVDSGVGLTHELKQDWPTSNSAQIPHKQWFERNRLGQLHLGNWVNSASVPTTVDNGSGQEKGFIHGWSLFYRCSRSSYDVLERHQPL